MTAALFTQTLSFADESYKLTRLGIPTRNYDLDIEQLKEGDTVFFGAKKFRLGKYLGQGTTAQIFSLAEQPDAVIRISKQANALRYIDSTISGEDFLNEMNIPHTKIISHSPGEFVVAQKLPSTAMQLNLAIVDAIKNPDKRSRLEAAILKFARLTAAVSRLGDFRFDQIAYDPVQDALILFDWRDDNTRAEAPSSKTIFEENPFNKMRIRETRQEKFEIYELPWLQQLDTQIDEAIHDERIKLFSQPQEVAQQLDTRIKAAEPTQPSFFGKCRKLLTYTRN